MDIFYGMCGIGHFLRMGLLLMWNLNVTTACSVVLLPSSQPLGRMPGEPQLISGEKFYHRDQKIWELGIMIKRMIVDEDDRNRIIAISTSYIDLVRLTNLYKWIEFDQNVIRVTSANWLKPGPDFVSLAPPHRLPDDHVAVVALVAEHHCCHRQPQQTQQRQQQQVHYLFNT